MISASDRKNAILLIDYLELPVNGLAPVWVLQNVLSTAEKSEKPILIPMRMAAHLLITQILQIRYRRRCAGKL